MPEHKTHGKAGLTVHESAVDLESDHVAPLKDPHLLAVAATDTAIRRRGSDSNRARPLSLAADIELTPLGPLSKFEDRQSERTDDALDVSKHSATVDVEQASSTSVVRSTVSQASSRDPSNPTSQLLTTPQTVIQRRWGMLQFTMLCYNFFLAGWNDGSTGPLLPTIQRAHNIGFAIVSLLFVFNAVGCIVGGLANVYLDDKYGFGKVLACGAVFQLVGYALLATGGPFPLMCVAFGIAGFGFSIQITQDNTFVGSLENASTKLGLMHASYGLGALTAPLVATHFSTQRHWSFHYLISTALAILNVALIVSVFRFKTVDEVKTQAGLASVEDSSSMSGNKYRKILGMSAVHFLALWCLIYVGTEVTLGGWIVTFLQEKRGAGASAGYISSAFFGGLMMGRLVLLWLNQKIGEHRVMFLYAFLAIVLEATIWAVPSFVENAIAVSCIGLLLGPMYPILVHHSSMILPKWLYVGAIGWISAFGQAGSAALPFLTGLLASKFGITALQPFIVSMMSTMVVLWALVPRVRRID